MQGKIGCIAGNSTIQVATHTALPCTLQPHLGVGCRVRAGGPARATIDIP
jgi:hypothetical protein